MTQGQMDLFLDRCRARRARLADGPWKIESDRVEFKHKGLDCMAVRSPTLFQWCGYVGVQPGHPYYGLDYDRVPAVVHGGLTYAGPCSGHICHARDDKESIWWFGFDCGHAGDLVPGFLELQNNRHDFSYFTKGHYWTEKEVIEATKMLAEEIAKAA